MPLWSHNVPANYFASWRRYRQQAASILPHISLISPHSADIRPNPLRYPDDTNSSHVVPVTRKQTALTTAITATKEKLNTMKPAAQQANEQLANGEITQEQYDALQVEIAATEVSCMSLAGWDASEMIDGLDSIPNHAAASGMDLATASDIVTDYLTAFRLSASDSEMLVDWMAYAMSNSNTTTEQLVAAFVTIWNTNDEFRENIISTCSSLSADI